MLIIDSLNLQAPLNNQLVKGELTWAAKLDTWIPLDVCVDWLKSDNFAWLCNLYQTSPITWKLTNCHDLSPHIKCTDYYKS